MHLTVYFLFKATRKCKVKHSTAVSLSQTKEHTPTNGINGFILSLFFSVAKFTRKALFCAEL